MQKYKKITTFLSKMLILPILRIFAWRFLKQKNYYLLESMN